jgi:hypothetical protein
MLYRKMGVKCTFFFLMDFKIGPILGVPSLIMVPKGCPQKLSQQTGGGLPIKRTRKLIHACKFRDSWRPWPHEGRIRTSFMICIKVGNARNFKELILNVAHVHHLKGHSKSPQPMPTFYTEEQKLTGCSSPSPNPRPRASRSHARARLRTTAKTKASMNWRKC